MQEEKSLKELMGKLFDDYHLTDKLAEKNLINNWEDLMGRTISKNTQRLFIHKNVLHIEVASAALKNDLIYYEETIVSKVNQFAGYQLITSIKIK